MAIFRALKSCCPSSPPSPPIFSRSTAKLDKGPKLRVYARSGVKELWLVDKEKKEVAVYRFAEAISEPVATVRGRQKLTTPLLPGLKIGRAHV